jgi:hypothetical protein
MILFVTMFTALFIIAVVTMIEVTKEVLEE